RNFIAMCYPCFMYDRPISAAMPMFCAERCVFTHFDGFFGVLAAGGICNINGEINNYFSC
ncbi:hypothetical protein QMZ20_28100, partial [Serratia bockelmannii]|nr:hypothetical protein [Serratia bockelmannii]